MKARPALDYSWNPLGSFSVSYFCFFLFLHTFLFLLFSLGFLGHSLLAGELSVLTLVLALALATLLA